MKKKVIVAVIVILVAGLFFPVYNLLVPLAPTALAKVKNRRRRHGPGHRNPGKQVCHLSHHDGCHAAILCHVSHREAVDPV